MCSNHNARGKTSTAWPILEDSQQAFRRLRRFLLQRLQRCDTHGGEAISVASSHTQLPSSARKLASVSLPFSPTAKIELFNLWVSYQCLEKGNLKDQMQPPDPWNRGSVHSLVRNSTHLFEIDPFINDVSKGVLPQLSKGSRNPRSRLFGVPPLTETSLSCMRRIKNTTSSLLRSSTVGHSTEHTPRCPKSSALDEFPKWHPPATAAVPPTPCRGSLNASIASHSCA